MALFLAALVALAGCGDDKKKKPEEQKVEATPKKELVSSGPVEKLTAPAGVIAFGGAKDLQAATKNLGGVFDPAMITEQVKGALALSKLELNKPLRFMLADPKKNPEGALVVGLELGGKSGGEAVLPKEKKADDEGNAYSYKDAGGKKIFVNFVEPYTVFTRTKDAFGKNKEFFTKLLGAEVKGGATVIVSVVNAQTVFKEEMDQAFDQMGKGPGAPGLGAGQLESMMGGVRDALKEVDTVAITIDPVDGGSTATLVATPKANSELQKSLAGMKAQPLSFLAKLPPKTTGAAVFAMKPEMGGLAEKIFSWSMRASLGIDDPKLVEASKEYWKASSGEMAYAFTEIPDTEGSKITMIAGITDQEAAQKYQDTLMSMYDDKAFNDRMGEMGMSYKVKRNAYEVAGAKATVVEMKIDGKKNPAAAVLGGMKEQHTIIGKDLQVSAFGEDAKKIITAWLDGKVPGGFDKAPPIVRAMKNKAPGTFFIAWGDPAAIMASVMAAAQPEGAKGAAPKAPPPTADGMALSLGAADGKLHVVFDLPTSTLEVLAAGAGPGMMGPGGL